MLNFSLYTLDGDHKFSIEEENEITIEFYSRLLLIFSKIDSKNKRVNFICTHQMTQKIKSDILDLVTAFEKKNIKLRKIASHFNKVPDGQFFFVFPAVDFNVQQIITLGESLILLNKGVPFERLEEELKKPMDQVNSIFKDIIKSYDLLVFDPHKKYCYGEPDKSKRKCKYCGKTEKEGATFVEEAHAISEALGNKTIISAEECDACNHRFSNSIEKDVFEYLKVFRVLYGKKGKNGIPNLIFKNGVEIKYKEGKAVILDKSGAGAISEKNFHIPLEYYHEINLMNIYRCFVKFAISVLPMEEIIQLSRTIDWINENKNDGTVLHLPPVASMIDRANYFDQPNIAIYRRKNKDYNLPHIYVELKIAFMIYVFIIPFSDNDKTDFSIKENFDRFWSFNKHYNHFDGWTFNSFNIDKKTPFILNLKIESMSDT